VFGAIIFLGVGEGVVLLDQFI